MPQKSPKVIISHSSQGKDHVSCIVDFLEDIGLRQEQLFCSSIPGHGILLCEDIYDYLKQQFQEHNLHVILILSDNYEQSIACMTEVKEKLGQLSVGNANVTHLFPKYLYPERPNRQSTMLL